jgi:acetolactate synthase regulatory subunit
MSTTTSDDANYRAALKLVSDTKRQMDSLQSQLDQAEDAWHQACQELDALEDARS